MNQNEILNAAVDRICAEWGLAPQSSISEEYIIDRLTEKIAQLISQGPEPFFQLMYRLDISEKKLTQMLPGADVARQVAEMVWQRQLQKVKSRSENSRNENDIDPELQW